MGGLGVVDGGEDRIEGVGFYFAIEVGRLDWLRGGFS